MLYVCDCQKKVWGCDQECGFVKCISCFWNCHMKDVSAKEIASEFRLKKCDYCNTSNGLIFIKNEHLAAGLTSFLH